MNLSVHQVTTVVRVGVLDETAVIAPKEGASEAEAVVAMTAVAMTAVGDMTAAVDTTVAEDLLVWGKLHSATAPKVPPYTVKYDT